MKPAITLLFLLFAALTVRAQDKGEQKKSFTQEPVVAFDSETKIISFGVGFPNFYRTAYDVPTGYTHLKTSGFGPMYAKFEFSAFDHVGLAASFSYSTFHYSYFDYTPRVIYYDDVNTLNLSLSGNYHFSNWITNPRLDVYAGGGLAVDYQKYSYGNIPPYKSPEHKAHIYPLIRAGARYYLDHTFGLYGEAGYDGLSAIQLGFSVRF